MTRIKFFIQNANETLSEAVKCHGEIDDMYDNVDECRAMANAEGFTDYKIHTIHMYEQQGETHV